jgi:hypothetical protein
VEGCSAGVVTPPGEVQQRLYADAAAAVMAALLQVTIFSQIQYPDAGLQIGRGANSRRARSRDVVYVGRTGRVYMADRWPEHGRRATSGDVTGTATVICVSLWEKRLCFEGVRMMCAQIPVVPCDTWTSNEQHKQGGAEEAI